MNAFPNRAQVIRLAINAAEAGKRDTFAKALSSIRLQEDSRAPIVERWLQAELAYVQGDYRRAIDLFAACDADRRAPSLAPWQRYLTSQRLAFAHHQRGEFTKSRKWLMEAERRLDGSTQLAARRPDLGALRAHHAELMDDLEGAKAALSSAYDAACRHGNWGRAATTAADLIRVSGVLGRPAEGYPWVKRAREALGHAPSTLVKATVSLREGMLLAMEGEHRDAKRIYDAVIAEAEPSAQNLPPLLVDALGRRADLFRLRAKLPEADADLTRALALAEELCLPRHTLYLEIDAAGLALARGGPKDTDIAAEHFVHALNLLASLKPAPRRVLRQMAEDLLAHPKLVGRSSLPETVGPGIRRTLDEIRRLGQPGVYQRSTWERDSQILHNRLSATLRAFSEPLITLATCVVDPITLKVKRYGEYYPIRPSELELLQLLISFGKAMTKAAISPKLGQDDSGVQQRLNRLRKAIGDDLQSTGGGRQKKIYSVRLPHARHQSESTSRRGSAFPLQSE